MSADVLVVGITKGGGAPAPVWEALGAARALASSLGGAAGVLLLGKGAAASSADAFARGAARVLVCDDERLEPFAPEIVRDTVLGAVRSLQPAAVLAPVSAAARDLFPRLSARLETGLATDCIGLEADGGEIRAVRPVYAGKAWHRVRFTARPALATLRPNAFEAPAAGAGGPASGDPERLPAAIPEGAVRTRVLREEAQEGGKPDQTEASVIVSGGRGLQGPEHFHLIEELAEALGGVVGASRVVVDLGWRPHQEQIGQTGKTVSPALYVACGISGAIQHLAGMRTSKVIVAVNKDPDAPIFQVATYGIVGDALDVLPRMIEESQRTAPVRSGT